MPLPWSRCGNYGPHDAHAGAGDVNCPGWTPHEQLVRDLITLVNEYLRERCPHLPGVPAELPAGLRLEMHQSVRRYLMVNADLWEPGFGLSGDISEWFRVPVKVNPELSKNTWRLVIVTEEVLLDGGLLAPETPIRLRRCRPRLRRQQNAATAAVLLRLDAGRFPG